MAIPPVSPYIPPASGVSAPGAVAREPNAAQPEPAQPAATPAAAPSKEQLDQAMGEVKKALAPVARNLQFSIDDETGRSIVKVVDASTNEVIRQFPSEELLAITRSIDKLSGLFVKHKA